MNTRYLKENEFPIWDEFVIKNGNNIFTRTLWQDMHSESRGYEQKIAVVEKKGVIIGGISFVTENKRIFRPKLTQFVSPVISERKVNDNYKKIKWRMEILRSLLEFLKTDFSDITFILLPEIDDVRSFVWDYWTVTPVYDLFLDLENYSEDRLSHNLRKNIKKSRAHDLKFVKDIDKYHDAYYEIFTAAYGRKEKDIPVNEKEFRFFITYLLKQKVLELSHVIFEGEIIGFRGNLLSGDQVFDWIGGTSLEHYDLGSTAFLLNELINEYRERDYARFVFGGANTPGIWDFKAQFQGELNHYFQAKLSPEAKKGLLARVKRKIFG